MMLLRMGENGVLGLTHENLISMAEGEVLVAPGDFEGIVQLFVVTGQDHETMRAALRAAGHDVPEGNGGPHEGGSDESEGAGGGP